jgi:hypothetical protein
MFAHRIARSRPARWTFTLWLAFTWSALPLLARQPAPRPPNPSEVADQLERLFALLEQARRELPRDRFDPAAVVATVGRDPARLAAWVRDNTAWVPYRGALRGARGVLMDRQGSSLDRAVLLATLLQQVGVETRLARGTLDDAVAKLLPTLLAKTPALPEPTEQMEQLRGKLPELAKQTGVSEPQLTQAFEQQAMKFEQFAEQLVGRVEPQVEALTRSLGTLEAAPANPAAALADHWWVQAKIDGNWTDFDLLAEAAGVGGKLTDAAGTVEFVADKGLQSLPEDQRHTLEVKVFIEKLAGGKVEAVQALAHTLLPADVLDRPIRVRNVPGRPQTLDQALAEKDPLAAMRKHIESQTTWTPTLLIGAAAIQDRAFDDTGELKDPPNPRTSAGEVGRGVNRGFGGLMGGGDDGAPQASASVLVGQYLEFTIRAPGESDRVVRREIFRLLASPADASQPIAAPTVDDAFKSRRAHALTHETALLPQVCRLSPEFVDALLMDSLLGNRRAMVEMLRRSTSDKPGPTGLGTPIFDGDLLTVARARFDNSPHAERLYVDCINLLATHQWYEPATELPLRVGKGFDIVANHLGVRGDDPAAVRVAQGVLESNAEALVLGDEATAAADPIARAAEAGVAPTTIRTEADLARLANVEPATLARMKDAIGRKQWVVAYAGDAAIESFFAVDPTSGQTLAIGSRGWGQALTEDLLMRILIGELATGYCLAGQLVRTQGLGQGGAHPAILIFTCIAAGITAGATAPLTGGGVLLSILGGFAGGLGVS